MSASQLKNLVIDKIYGIEDEDFLAALKKSWIQAFQVMLHIA